MTASHRPPETVAVAVDVNALTKRFGTRRALDDVSFAVRSGEILGVLGPNGAGKSTLIGVLCGLLQPDAGRVSIFGQHFDRDRAAILGRMNIASPYASLPGQLTVRQSLGVYASLYGMRQPGPRIAELLQRFGIAMLAQTRFATLSSGQAIRVLLCKALLNRPALLLLDEPTVYLDPDIAAQTRRLILQERDANGTTILLTSHNLAEIAQLCDRVLLLREGRSVACGTPLEITRAVLGATRESPALDEVFARLAAAGAT